MSAPSETCEAIEGEVFVCGELAQYATKRDGRPSSLCAHHAVLAVREEEVVFALAGHLVAYDHIDDELYEVAS